MSEEKITPVPTLVYHYPRDCGEYTLGDKRGEPVTVITKKCYHTETFRHGGHLSLHSQSDSSDSDNDIEYACDLALELYDDHWHVYYADITCDMADTRLLGRFSTFEGAEIYARILFARRNNGDGLFHEEQRVRLDVLYADEGCKSDFAMPQEPSYEGPGDYIILAHVYACHVHSLNPYDDWDQEGKTPLSLIRPKNTGPLIDDTVTSRKKAKYV